MLARIRRRLVFGDPKDAITVVMHFPTTAIRGHDVDVHSLVSLQLSPHQRIIVITVVESGARSCEHGQQQHEFVEKKR